MRFKGLTGTKFDRLTVISLSRKKGQSYHWQCLCECGKAKIVSRNNLQQGHTRSCGCLWKETAIKNARSWNLTHGKSHTPEFKSWTAMRARCNCATNQDYARYGGRGIKVDKKWDKSFEAFYTDMGSRPDGMSLDRINVNGDYEPGNCRWATQKEQMHNRRPLRRIEDFSDEELATEVKRRILAKISS